MDLVLPDATAALNAVDASAPFPPEVQQRLAEEMAVTLEPNSAEHAQAKAKRRAPNDLAPLGQGIPDNTRRAYASDWSEWLTWCMQRGRRALPASPTEVATYLASLSELTSPEGEGVRFTYTLKTIVRRSTAINVVHKAHGHPEPRFASVVRETVAAIRARREGQETPRRVETLIDLSMLTAFLRARPAPGWPENVTRRRDRWVLSSGYAGGLERGAMAGMLVGDVVPDHDADSGEPILRLLLQRESLAPGGPQVALVRGSSALVCPLCAYLAWIEVLEANQAGGPQDVRQLFDGRPEQDELDLESGHRCDAIVRHKSTLDDSQPLCPRVWASGKIGDKPSSGEAVRDLIKNYAQRIGEDPNLYTGSSLSSGKKLKDPMRSAVSSPTREWVRSDLVGLYIPLARPRGQL